MKVRFFARARELAGADMLNLDLPAGATVAELRRRIALAYPQIQSMLARCAIAVNEEFADDESVLPQDAEVAVLPPVSGGR
jgi:molybdopterin converting factor subunit 1